MKNGLWMVLIALVVGGLLGWGVAAASNNPSITILPRVGIGGGPEDTANDKAEELRLTLNKLIAEHNEVAVLHLHALYDGKDTTATQRLLETNSAELAQVLASVYGDGVKDEFLTLWVKHINQYESYTQARKDNDENRMNQERENLQNTAMDLGSYFNKISSNIQADEASTHMKTHINGTLAIVDAYAQGDQVKMVNLIKQSAEHGAQFADFLAEHTIQAKPEVFGR